MWGPFPSPVVRGANGFAYAQEVTTVFNRKRVAGLGKEVRGKRVRSQGKSGTVMGFTHSPRVTIAIQWDDGAISAISGGSIEVEA